MTKIGHIVNPVIVSKSSDLHVAQPITFESMRVARQLAAKKVNIDFVSAQYPEDHSLVPDDFLMTPDLERSILDVGNFQQQRKLPFIVDILDRLYESTDADYLIYSNVDIALMPHFYLAVHAMIASGYDAFVINRRTIPGGCQSIGELPLMYSEVGKYHEGHDCFVFPRKLYPDFVLENVCVGIAWIGRALIWNLACHGQHFEEFGRKDLTFHIGDDKPTQGTAFYDYRAYNKSQARSIIEELTRRHAPFERLDPFSTYPIDVGLDTEPPSLTRRCCRRLTKVLRRLRLVK